MSQTWTLRDLGVIAIHVLGGKKCAAREVINLLLGLIQNEASRYLSRGLDGECAIQEQLLDPGAQSPRGLHLLDFAEVPTSLGFRTKNNRSGLKRFKSPSSAFVVLLRSWLFRSAFSITQRLWLAGSLEQHLRSKSIDLSANC